MNYNLRRSQHSYVKKILVGIGLILVVLCVFIINISSSNKIYDGILIEGVDVGGKTVEEAAKYIEEYFTNQLKERTITIKGEEKETEINLFNLGINYNYDKACGQAFRIAREGNFIKNTIKYLKLKNSKIDISLEVTQDIESSKRNILPLVAQINRNPRNATIILKDNVFTIQDEVTGRWVDIDKSIVNIKKAVLEKSHEVTLYINPIEPEVTRDDLEKIKEPLVRFTTKVPYDNENRIHNIRLAASTLNGALVMPDNIFSFNSRVGLTTEEYGYKEAPVIISGKLEAGFGGGVCQVTTTLYNAVLLGGLEVIERRNHSIPSSYVDKGRDATVSDNYIDFKFRNNTHIPIYISSKVSGSVLEVVLYSVENTDFSISIETKVIEEIDFETEIVKDPQLPIGQIVEKYKGRKGYRVESYRVFTYKNGDIKREFLSRDLYKPSNKIVHQGTAEENQ